MSRHVHFTPNTQDGRPNTAPARPPSAHRHPVPTNLSNRPAWFSPSHNVWIERHAGVPPGTVLQIYQSDPAVIEAARLAIQKAIAEPEGDWIDPHGRRRKEVPIETEAGLSERRKLRWRMDVLRGGHPRERMGHEEEWWERRRRRNGEPEPIAGDEELNVSPTTQGMLEEHLREAQETSSKRQRVGRKGSRRSLRSLFGLDGRPRTAG